MWHANESCHSWVSHVTAEWVMSRMNESCHEWMSHVIRICIMWHANELCHLQPLHVTHKRAVSPDRHRHPTQPTSNTNESSHINESRHVWTIHVTWLALPPEASMGSTRRTSLDLISFGSLLKKSLGSAVTSSLWINIFPIGIPGYCRWRRGMEEERVRERKWEGGSAVTSSLWINIFPIRIPGHCR